MTIVIDIGAMHHEPEESTYELATRFHPDVLFAFDPFGDFPEGVEQFGPTTIIRRRQAAWISNGVQSYLSKGMCSGVVAKGDREVKTFDLAEFLRKLDHPVIMKMDCEGAEYVLLPHLRDEGVDDLISGLFIEWHPEHLANGWYVSPRERYVPDCIVLDWNDYTGLETEAESTEAILRSQGKWKGD